MNNENNQNYLDRKKQYDTLYKRLDNNIGLAGINVSTNINNFGSEGGTNRTAEFSVSGKDW